MISFFGLGWYFFNLNNCKSRPYCMVFYFFLDKKVAKNQGCTCFAKNRRMTAVATQAVRYRSLLGSSGRGHPPIFLTLTS
jgi:hypothetical protein